MKWFKHDADANQDAKLKRLRMKYGLEGYGLYWYCLELVANGVDDSKLNFELEHDAEIIAFDTGIHYERVQEMMSHMVSLGLFENDAGVITCMKMAQRLDKSMTSSPAVRKMISGMRAESRDYDGYVYFILAERDGDRKIKIGRSKNPWQRIKEMRATDQSEGYDLSFLAKIKTSDSLSLEEGLHRSFVQMKIKDDWFQYDRSMVDTAEAMSKAESDDYVDLLRHVVVSPEENRLEEIREDKSREEKPLREESSDSSLPKCPHSELLDAWCEILPSKRQPRRNLWKPDRAEYKHLAQRWKEMMNTKHSETGEPLYSTREDGIAWWRGFFNHIAQSKFLMDDHRWFDIKWVVNKSNFYKIIEGNYHE